MQVLQNNAKLAATTLVEASARGEMRDRIAASRDVLDRVGVGKQLNNTAAPGVDIKFLTMAPAGIAALAGRNVEQFGDMTDLQERLEAVVIDTQPQDVEDAEFEYEAQEEQEEQL
jgi:hypothetical protein